MDLLNTRSFIAGRDSKGVTEITYCITVVALQNTDLSEVEMGARITPVSMFFRCRA